MTGRASTCSDVRRRSSGLGLVAGLARQIGGGFIVKRPKSKGARCIVRFRDDAGRVALSEGQSVSHGHPAAAPP